MSELGNLVYKQQIYPLSSPFYIYLLPALIIAPFPILGIFSGIYLGNLVALILWSLLFSLPYYSIRVALYIYSATFIKIYENGIKISIKYESAKYGNVEVFYFENIDQIFLNDLDQLEIITQDKDYVILLREPYIRKNEITQAANEAKRSYDKKI